MGLISDQIQKDKAAPKKGGLLEVPSMDLLRDDNTAASRPPAPESVAPPAPSTPPATLLAPRTVRQPLLTREDVLRVLQGAPEAMLPAWDPMLSTGTPTDSVKAVDMPTLPGEVNVQVRVTQESHHIAQAFNNLARNNASIGIPDYRAIARYSLHVWRLVYGPEILRRYQKLPKHLQALPDEVREEVQRCTWEFEPGLRQ